MALLASTSTTTSSLRLYFISFYAFSNSSNSSSFPFPSRPLFRPLSCHSSVGCPGRCHAASLGPPPPPRTDPPPGNDPRQLQEAGMATSWSKIKDRVQIFFAVLFWMSLFFWSSAWDGRNGPKKGSRRRR
ncbi:uncharacterized protein LOC129291621 [Prosopis cineraria]|uniref:uncharacterized protein LOC129291621 n=1 Tax=Prosopis cineraria TaxID=364024 RepID=UPI00240FCB6E|nr:uncharacterized protein LOC129291621 [Prosopis cineraria]